MSEQLYKAYVQLVKRLCDDVNCSYNSNWRDRYYATCIDNVEAIFLESTVKPLQDQSRDNAGLPNSVRLPSYPGSGALTVSETPTSALSNGSSHSSESSNPSISIASSSPSAISESSASSVSGQSQAAASASAAPSMVFVATKSCLTSTSKRHQCSTGSISDDPNLTCSPFATVSASTSPETAVATTPSSATYTVSPSSEKNKAYCELCSKSFSGTRQHRQSNLKRHMNDVHQQSLRLLCSEPGCGKRCGRADNLRNHRLKVHGIDDPRVRPSNSKRQPRSAKTRARTPPNLLRSEMYKRSLW